ncbi:MAG: hypothetical protein ABWK01_06500 [Infirmifilum sp.]
MVEVLSTLDRPSFISAFHAHMEFLEIVKLGRILNARPVLSGSAKYGCVGEVSSLPVTWALLADQGALSLNHRIIRRIRLRLLPGLTLYIVC